MDENVLFYVIIFLVTYIVTKKLLHKYQNLPPSPFPTLPIFGHLYLFRNPKQIHRTLAKVSDRYGPVVQLWLGFRRTLLVSSASAAEDCFHHNDVIFANRPRLLGAKILGYDYTNLLWAPYGPLWRNHRRIAATEILSPHRLSLLAHIRADEVTSLLKRLYDHHKEDHIVEIKPALFELTNNVMMRMIAGKRMYGDKVESDEAKRFKLIMKELLSSGGAFSGGDFFPFFKFLGLNKANERKWMAIFAKIDKFFQDLVDEQRNKMMKEEESERNNLNSKNRNLIQVLVGLQKNDPDYFTEDIIKGLVMILLFTGTETSSSIMEWAVTLLLKNPEIHSKARKEIDQHVGRDRLIEEQNLNNLPYLHCIINETLRMYPAAPIIPPHESTEDCVVGGYRVPKGTMLNVNLWAIQNDPKVWDEPSKFKPERFENVEGNRIGYMFMPFGSGRRVCPGQNLATRVVGLTVGSLIQCFEWEGVGEEVDMEEKVAVSMWKAKPLQAKFKPRNEMVDLISQI